MAKVEEVEISALSVPDLEELIQSGVEALYTEDDTLNTRFIIHSGTEEAELIGEGEVVFVGEEEGFREGWYRHYKGGVYYAYGICIDYKAQRYVLYHHVSDVNEGGLWLRPIESFISYVKPESDKEFAIKRFIYVRPKAA